MATEPRHELVKAQPNGATYPLTRDPERWNLDVQSPAFWSNIDYSTPQGKALVMRADGAPDNRADDVIGKTFPLAWALCHPVELPDKETGEVLPCVRTVLFTPDGKTIGFVSEGILRSLRKLIMLYGKGPWYPPLEVELRQHQLQGGKRTFSLVTPLILDPIPKGGKSAK